MREEIIERLKNQLEFDEDEIKMVLDSFFESANEALENLQIAIENNDLEKIAYFAHSIKGSALNLSIEEIASLAKEIELSAKEKKDIDYEKKFNQLEKLIKNLKK